MRTVRTQNYAPNLLWKNQKLTAGGLAMSEASP